MSLNRLSLIFAGAGWAFGVLIFALIQLSGATDFHNAMLQFTPLLCGCVLPTLWIVGAMLSGNHALALARAQEQVPKSSVVALSLNLLGLAVTLIYMLLTLIAAP
jgi:hypothetical protein